MGKQHRKVEKRKRAKRRIKRKKQALNAICTKVLNKYRIIRY